jgi:hypothetical protein
MVCHSTRLDSCYSLARLDSTHVIRSTRLGSCYSLDATQIMLFARLNSTRFMEFARLDSPHAIRSTKSGSCYSLNLTRRTIRARYCSQSSLSLHQNATIDLDFASSSQCDDRFGFRFITMRRSIWILLHHNATIDLDFASSKCDDQF